MKILNPEHFNAALHLRFTSKTIFWTAVSISKSSGECYYNCIALNFQKL